MFKRVAMVRFVLAAVLVAPLGLLAVGSGEAKPERPGYTLADAGGASGLWVQRPGAKPLAALYSQQGGGSDHAALAFYRDSAKPAHGCDFGVAATADGVHFQVRDAAGEFHLVPVTDLLKLAKADGCQCKCPCCNKVVPDEMPRPPAAKADAPKAGPSVTFEEALRDQIEGRPETIRSRRVLAVLDMEPSARRDRILNRMERHAAAQLELKGEVGKIDWGAVDWAKFFDLVMKILAAILPFLLMAEADPAFPLDLFLALLGFPPLGVG